jgi:hypothetical protein
MGVLATVVGGILAAVSQRAFWTETPIKELVRGHKEKVIESWYGRADRVRSPFPLGDLRAMRIFATDQQQTWLVVISGTAYCVLDDRRREEPRVQWWNRLESVLEVRADENWSVAAGVVRFGNNSKGWLYSKELFPNEAADIAISHFLAGNDC